jgi:hypothetical protein
MHWAVGAASAEERSNSSRTGERVLREEAIPVSYNTYMNVNILNSSIMQLEWNLKSLLHILLLKPTGYIYDKEEYSGEADTYNSEYVMHLPEGVIQGDHNVAC